MQHTVKFIVIIAALITCNLWYGAAAESVFTRGMYTATVAEDGSMISLKIKGKEFLHTRGSNPRGVYLFQGNAFGLKHISRPDKDHLVGSNEQAVVTYTFGAEKISWNVRNLTEKKLTLLIAFAPGVEAVRHAPGLYEKVPFATKAQETTWFRDELKLDINNGGRIWGPWGAQKLQIWQIDINAKEEHTSTLTPGTADKEQLAGVKAALNYVAEPPTDPVGPMWDPGKLSNAPAKRPAGVHEAEGVEAIFYEGLPYRGRPTEVFAYLGMPDVPEGTKVPGIVLIHGGGGTAFADWVKLWISRGYAAISMDTCGSLPGGGYGKRVRHAKGGPGGWGGYNQIDWPRTDQWAYHAIADVILAHSLLRSLPEVDKERTGVTGISWGGYLCSMVSGVDSRFKFAAPVYGCGFTTMQWHGMAKSVLGLGEERAARWMRWWDPSSYLADAKMPMLWVSGSNDFAYTLNALQKSYRLPKSPHTLCITLRMPHGQRQGAEPEVIKAFADSIIKKSAPLAKITETGAKNGKAWAAFESSVPIVKAELNYTCDTGKWQDRKWEVVSARIEGHKVTAVLPEGTNVHYINLIDERKLVVSTEHVEVTQ